MCGWRGSRHGAASRGRRLWECRGGGGACSSTPTDRADIVVSVDSSSSAQTNFFLVCGTLRFFFFARNGNSIHSVVVF